MTQISRYRYESNLSCFRCSGLLPISYIYQICLLLSFLHLVCDENIEELCCKEEAREMRSKDCGSM